MTRIVLTPAPAAAPEVSREGIGKRIVRSIGRKIRNTLIGLLIFLLIVGGPTAYLLARSGFVTVPGLSNLIYTPPEPDHVVEAGRAVEDQFQAEVDAIIAERLTPTGLTDRDAVFAFHESALTASLRTLIINGTDTVVDPERSQVAVIDGEEVEVFLPLRVNKGKTAVTIGVTFGVENGLLTALVTRVKVGRLAVPRFLSSWTLQPAVNQALQSMNQELGRYVRFSTVAYEDQSVRLNAELIVEVKPVSP